MADLVADDTGCTLVYDCLDNETGAAIPLDGIDVSLRWTDPDGLVQERAMAVTSASGGRAEYTFAAGELFAPEMRFEVRLTDSGGLETTSLDLETLAVRARLA